MAPGNEWARHVAAASGIALAWAALWAATGALVGIADRGGSLARLWLGPPIGVHPGLVGGIGFVVVTGIAARAGGFAHLPRVAVVATGAVVGLVLGVLPFAINQPPGDAPLWLVAGVVVGSMTLMGALSAAVSLALVRVFQ